MREQMKKHQPDYNLESWRNYTIQELGWWVALLFKRASHRSNKEKQEKDLHDAKNYLHMIEMKLADCAEDNHIDWDKL